MCMKDFEGCKECGHGTLDYEAELAAPGRGSSWVCPECGIGYHKVGNTFTSWDSVDPENIEMTPAMVR